MSKKYYWLVMSLREWHSISVNGFSVGDNTPRVLGQHFLSVFDTKDETMRHSNAHQVAKIEVVPKEANT